MYIYICIYVCMYMYIYIYIYICVIGIYTLIYQKHYFIRFFKIPVSLRYPITTVMDRVFETSSS